MGFSLGVRNLHAANEALGVTRAFRRRRSSALTSVVRTVDFTTFAFVITTLRWGARWWAEGVQNHAPYSLRPCVHTYIYMHTYTHNFICTYIITYIFTYIHTYIHKYAQTDGRADGRMGGCVRGRAWARTCIGVPAYLHMVCVCARISVAVFRFGRRPWE